MENNTNPNENMEQNNTTPVNPNPNTVNQVNNVGGVPENKHESSVGPIVGVIVILAIILIGGIYYFMSIRQNSTPPIETPVAEENTSTENTSESTTEDFSATIQTQSSSDDLTSIENDLNSFGGAEIDQATAY